MEGEALVETLALVLPLPVMELLELPALEGVTVMLPETVRLGEGEVELQALADRVLEALCVTDGEVDREPVALEDRVEDSVLEKQADVVGEGGGVELGLPLPLTLPVVLAEGQAVGVA